MATLEDILRDKAENLDYDSFPYNEMPALPTDKNFGLTEQEYYNPQSYGFEGAQLDPNKVATDQRFRASEEPQPANRQVRIIGNAPSPTDQFQSLGKYATPEEFFAKDPAGFQLTNPGLYPAMAAKAQKAAVGNLSLEASGLTLKQVGDRVKAIEGMTNTQDMMTAIAQLNGDIFKSKAKFYETALGQSEAEFQIPQLKQALVMQEKMDKADPNYPGYASKATEEVRKALQSAQAAARGDVKEKLAMNPLLAELEGSVKYLEKFAEVSLNRRIQTEARTAQKAEDRQEALEFKVDQFLEGLGDKKKLIPMMFEEAVAGSKTALYARINSFTPQQKKDFEEAITVGEQGAAKLALRGNLFAKDIVKSVEERNGLSADQIKTKYNELQDVVNNPLKAGAAYKEMVTKGYLKKDPGLEAEVGLFASDLSLKGNKEALETGKEFRLNLAEQYASMKMAERLDGDISKWKSSTPTPAFISQFLADPAKNTRTPVTRDQLISHIQTLPKPQQSVALKEFRDYYLGAIGEANKSLFGSINPLRANDIALKASMGVFMSTLSNVIQVGADTANEAGLMIGAPINAALAGMDLLQEGNFTLDEAMRRGVLNTIGDSQNKAMLYHKNAILKGNK